jgi:eukaryotic-like serine/threonine-protein kinase
MRSAPPRVATPPHNPAPESEAIGPGSGAGTSAVPRSLGPWPASESVDAGVARLPLGVVRSGPDALETWVEGTATDTGGFGARLPQALQALLDVAGGGESSWAEGLLASLAGPACPESPLREGMALGEFRLLSLLGRGRQGEVFLASQTSLADRPVVLKLTPREGQEHLSLARLQHPNIVPLFGVQEFRDGKLRAICMPYLGGATLARLLAAMGRVPPRRRTGRDLVATLDRLGRQGPVESTGDGPARRFLAGASYVQAVCWVGACLAEALQYAHERGVLHLDLKPSNVLIAADGRPMLLDFHLAQGEIRPGVLPQRMGGTHGYMPPEQQAVLGELRAGRTAPVAVDRRADVYALGALLLEMLGGGAQPSLSRRQIRRRTRAPRELAGILARCLATDPRSRHPDAAGLATDLRRCLANLSARRAAGGHALRRRLLPAGATLTAVLATLAAGLVVAEDLSRRVRGAEAALAEGRTHLGAREYADAVRHLERGRALLGRPPLAALDCAAPRLAALVRALDEQLQRARLARDAAALHQLVERVRPLYGTDIPVGDGLHALVPRLREAWELRSRFAAGLGRGQDPAAEARLEADLLDLALLWADLRVRLASGEDARAARWEALQTLREAEDLLGPSPALERERRAFAEDSDPIPRPAGPTRLDPEPAVGTARDLKTRLLRAGEGPTRPEPRVAERKRRSATSGRPLQSYSHRAGISGNLTSNGGNPPLLSP